MYTRGWEEPPLTGADMRPQAPRVTLLAALLLTSTALPLINPQILRARIDRAVAGDATHTLVIIALVLIGSGSGSSRTGRRPASSSLTGAPPFVAPTTSSLLKDGHVEAEGTHDALPESSAEMQRRWRHDAGDAAEGERVLAG